MPKPTRELRDLAFVPRWGIARVIRRQSVAEHSFFVAHYADWLASEISWEGDLGLLLWYALWHDVSESFMSDIPGPIKRAIATPGAVATYEAHGMIDRFGGALADGAFEARNLADVKKLVKAADLIDECCYIAGEMQMGNRAIRNFETMCRERLSAAVMALPATQDLLQPVLISVLALVESELSGLSKAP